MKPVIFLLGPLLLLNLSCSSDDTDVMEAVPRTLENNLNKQNSEDDPGSDLDSEIEITAGSIAEVRTMEEVQALGWNSVYIDPETGKEFRAQIGYLYLNPDRIDRNFKPGEPEGVLLGINPAGYSRVHGVAFIMEGNADNPPEGFSGETDIWQWMPEEQQWVLHVWLRAKNPNGIFSFHHPEIVK